MPSVTEWPSAQLRRALGTAVVIALAGLLLGALLAAWAGGEITWPGGLPDRAKPPGEHSPGESGPLPERPSPGYPAPDIEAKALDGERVRLGDCAGEVVLLTFFNTASAASLAHISVLAQIHTEGLTGMRVVAIAVFEKPDAVLAYMEARKLDLPVIADPRGELARLYEITAVPTTFVIDARGIVRDLRVGAMTRAQLERAVRASSDAAIDETRRICWNVLENPPINLAPATQMPSVRIAS